MAEQKPSNEQAQPMPPFELGNKLDEEITGGQLQIQPTPSKTYQLPKIEDLYADKAAAGKSNELNILLNQPPKIEWLKEHPLITLKKKDAQGNAIKVPYVYIPIERIEWLLTCIFINWHVEIKTVILIANSVVSTIRLWFLNPITNEWNYQDGVGAMDIHTKSGAGATEFDKLLVGSVQKAAPAAESYAIKDAAEKIGKIFGKDLNRADEVGYNALIQKFPEAPVN